MMLFSLILAPLASAFLVALGPAAMARRTALAGTAVTFFAACAALYLFNWSAPGYQFEQSLPWLQQVGINLSVGVDSVAMMLIALTALLGPICVQSSKTAITDRVKTYYSWLLVLQAAMTGVFASRDLILFYICFEFTLAPMFVLISLYGSTNRRKAAIKFFLYTFTGSVIALAGFVYVAWFSSRLTPGIVNAADPSLLHEFPQLGKWTFDLATLEQAARLMSPAKQGWVLLALLAGFAVKVPLFPVHTWLPLAHTEAPTAGSVILAGVLLKLGTYAIYRFALPFCPVAIYEHAPLISVLCIVGILYGGLICWVQTDVKKLVAYSSVAHLGFCILGMMALNNTGISGSILYMINHGLSTGALFLLIGMIYERYHTRSMKELGGIAAKMPIWATFMVFFTMASVGLPGLNGFVSEFLCILGAFQASSAWGSPTATLPNGLPNAGLWGSAGAAHPGSTLGSLGPWFAAVAGIGMIVAAIYLLYMVGKVVWGPLVEPHGHDSHGGHGGHGESESHSVLPTDLCAREIGVLVPLAVLCVALGVYPKPALDALSGPVSDTVRVVQTARSNATIPADSVKEAAR
ncbi:MAG: NADH-quinone oxidoreductase subunit M [Planctomycetes bacterium]|nr:NADH-quinone oxidoreductase subunit M [Planctomycetota bacterium]